MTKSRLGENTCFWFCRSASALNPFLAKAASSTPPSYSHSLKQKDSRPGLSSLHKMTWSGWHLMTVNTKVLCPQEEYQEPHSLTRAETPSTCSTFSKIFVSSKMSNESALCYEFPRLGLMWKLPSIKQPQTNPHLWSFYFSCQCSSCL